MIWWNPIEIVRHSILMEAARSNGCLDAAYFVCFDMFSENISLFADTIVLLDGHIG